MRAIAKNAWPMLMLVAVLPATALASVPVKSMTPFVQEFVPLNDGYWQRDEDFEELMDPLEIPTVQNSYGGWHATVCALAWTQRTRDALNDLIAIGVPFTYSGPHACGLETNREWLFVELAGPMVGGKRVLNATSHVRVVTNPNDNAYQLMQDLGGPFGGSDLVAMAVRATVENHSVDQHGSGVLERSTGWDILINGADFDFLPGKPSEYTSVVAGQTPEEKFQYATILHELLHVLGAGHLPDDSDAPQLSSVMYSRAGDRGHWMEEYDADLWDPAAYEGTVDIPLSDFLFIEANYDGISAGGLTLPRFHSWRMKYVLGDGVNTLDSWEVRAFGGDLSYDNPRLSLFIGSFCEGDSMSPASADLVNRNMPGMSDLIDASSSVVITVKEQGSPSKLFQFNGYGFYNTTEDGAMWSEDHFLPPQTTGDAPWTAGSFTSPSETEDKLGQLQLYDVASDSRMWLPFVAEQKRDCACPTPYPVPSSCCAQDCAGGAD